MIKPILIPTDKSNIMLYNNNRLALWNGCFNKSSFAKPQQIILVDTEAEIVEGDVFYSIGKLLMCKRIHFNNYIEHESNDFISPIESCAKIISSTNKSHNILQLSPQSIQLLINYYNEHECMPENVDVEEFKFTHNKYSGATAQWHEYKIKLNKQGEVDIKPLAEVEPKLYTEKEMKSAFEGGYQYRNNIEFKGFQAEGDWEEWFNSKKK